MEDEEIINISFAVAGENFNPEEVKILIESNQYLATLPDNNLDQNTFAGTDEDDWEATIELKSNYVQVQTVNYTSPYIINSITGIKVVEITYQGTTYTKFNYR